MSTPASCPTCGRPHAVPAHGSSSVDAPYTTSISFQRLALVKAILRFVADEGQAVNLDRCDNRMYLLGQLAANAAVFLNQNASDHMTSPNAEMVFDITMSSYSTWVNKGLADEMLIALRPILQKISTASA